VAEEDAAVVSSAVVEKSFVVASGVVKDRGVRIVVPLINVVVAVVVVVDEVEIRAEAVRLDAFCKANAATP